MRTVNHVHITDEYRQTAREAVLSALEKVRGYFQSFIHEYSDQEDEYFIKKVKAKTNTLVVRTLFQYARRHRMLHVSSMRPHPCEPDMFMRQHREPMVTDMPKYMTDLGALVTDYEDILKDFVTECRQWVPTPEEDNS